MSLVISSYGRKRQDVRTVDELTETDQRCRVMVVVARPIDVYDSSSLFVSHFVFYRPTGEQEKHIVETEFAMISDLGIYLRTDRGAAEK